MPTIISSVSIVKGFLKRGGSININTTGSGTVKVILDTGNPLTWSFSSIGSKGLELSQYSSDVDIEFYVETGTLEYEHVGFVIESSRQVKDGEADLFIKDDRGNIIGIAAADFPLRKQLRATSNGQPQTISRPCKKIGNKAIGFATTDAWSIVNGTAGTDFIVTEDHSGYDASGNITGLQSRTGVSKMKKVQVLTDSLIRFRRQSLSIDAKGRLGLWVYFEASKACTITITLGSVNGSSAVDYNFNSNQTKPNTWNFLVIARANNPISNADREMHPFGLTEAFADYTSAQWCTQTIKSIWVQLQGMSATTVYLDSFWTGMETTAQFVLGADQTGQDTIDYVLPEFKKYGWKGYIAEPFRLGSYEEIANLSAKGRSAALDAVYAAGWDVVNHSMNHLTMATLTDAGQIRYEVDMCRAWLVGLGYEKGQEFFVSPVSSSSMLTRKVIKAAGYVVQRHGGHDANHVTPFGMDDASFVGSIDVGASTWIFNQVDAGLYPYNYPHIAMLRKWVDMIIKYQATGFPFWHGVTALGDPGDGSGQYTLNTTTMYLSTFRLLMQYIAEKEAQGLCRVPDGFTGFYYGSGR